MARVPYLKKSAFFQNFTDKEIAVLAALMDEKQYPINTFMSDEGSIGGAFYLIKKGKVKLSKDLEPIENMPLIILGAGQIFGEFSVIHSTPRFFTIRTIEPTELLILSKEKFEILADKSPKIAFKFLKAAIINASMRFEMLSKEYFNDILLFLLSKGSS